MVNITMKPTPKFIGFIQWRIKNLKAVGVSLFKSILKYGTKLNVFGKVILVYFVLHIENRNLCSFKLRLTKMSLGPKS